MRNDDEMCVYVIMLFRGSFSAVAEEGVKPDLRKKAEKEWIEAR